VREPLVWLRQGRETAACRTCRICSDRFTSEPLDLLQNLGKGKNVHHLMIVAVDVHERDAQSLLGRPPLFSKRLKQE
jgi:hypothetical protein